MIRRYCPQDSWSVDEIVKFIDGDPRKNSRVNKTKKRKEKLSSEMGAKTTDIAQRESVGGQGTKPNVAEGEFMVNKLEKSQGKKKEPKEKKTCDNEPNKIQYSLCIVTNAET